MAIIELTTDMTEAEERASQNSNNSNLDYDTMRKTVYDAGTGESNTNTVDHAEYADGAGSADSAAEASAAASGSDLETQIAQLFTGWLSLISFGTFVSATSPFSTMTISGDFSAVLSQKMKIKLTNSTTKYFTVYSVSYASGTGLTTIVLYSMGNVLASGTISDIYYSVADCPFGFRYVDKWVPMVKAYNATTQSITYNSDTVPSLPYEDFDTDSMHSTSSNTGRIVITTPGLYEFKITASWASNTTGAREVWISGIKNGVSYSSRTRDDVDGVSNGRSTGQAYVNELYMVAGDYMDAKIWQGAGAALNLEAIEFIARLIG